MDFVDALYQDKESCPFLFFYKSSFFNQAQYNPVIFLI